MNDRHLRLSLALLLYCAEACSADVKTIGGDADAGPPPFSIFDASAARDASTPADAGAHDSGLSHVSSGSAADAGTGGTSTGRGMGGADDVSAVPDEEIFCDAPDVTGQTIVVPCVTSIELSSSWERPTPGGSHCNDGWYYTISVVTNMFRWSKCMDGPNPGDPWEPNSGERRLSEDELASLLKALQVMTLSSATECAGMDDVPRKTAYIVTRTAISKYTDSHYGCYIEEIFVDHIDEALSIVDAMAH